MTETIREQLLRDRLLRLDTAHGDEMMNQLFAEQNLDAVLRDGQQEDSEVAEEEAENA